MADKVAMEDIHSNVAVDDVSITLYDPNKDKHNKEAN